MGDDWRGQTLFGRFEGACDTYGDKVALKWGDSEITYRGLLAEIERLVAGFDSLGIKHGDRVAYMFGATPQWVETYYALLRIGAVIVPLNTMWIGSELQIGLELTQVHHLIVQDEHRGRSLTTVFSDRYPEIASQQRGKISISSLPLLRTIIVAGRPGHPAQRYPFAYELDELKVPAADVAEHSHPDTRPVAASDHAMYLLTSGSTSFPKPIIHTNESILFAYLSLGDAGEVSSADTWLLTGTTYHISAYLALAVPLMRGGTVVLMEHYKADQAMRLIERHQVNTMWGFDTHFLAIRRHELYGMFDLSSLEKTWVGSQPGSFDEIKSLGVSWQGNIYANSECAACGTFYPYRLREDEFHMKYSHGLPVPGSEIVIIDPETHEHLGPNEKGEICIRGPQLFLGYYNLPEETAKAFVEEGLHRTGDYGWMDEDGFVYYSGRYKEMLKSGGENVSVAEVEQTLVLETPWVSQAIVVGLPDPKWGEKIVALIQLRADVDVSPEQLRLRSKEVMAGYKVPKEFVFVTEDQWIVTPTGKFDRKAMRRFAAACLGQPLGDSRQEEIRQ